MERQLYTHLTVAQLTRDARDAGWSAAVLRPWEPFEPDASGLAIMHAAQRDRRRKERNNFQSTFRNDRAETITTTHHAAGLEGRDLCDDAVNWRPYHTLCDLVAKPVGCG